MNDFLALVSYPSLTEEDEFWINEFRTKNDIYYNLIKPHFSFIFPIEDLSIEILSSEISRQLTGVAKIPFTIKSAIRNNDLTTELWHVLLVPDEGFSDITKLHNKLYSGLISPYERLDLDFIPHIGIGNSENPHICKQLIEEVHKTNICIKGIIDKLELVQYKHGAISTIKEFRLT